MAKDSFHKQQDYFGEQIDRAAREREEFRANYCASPELMKEISSEIFNNGEDVIRLRKIIKNELGIGEIDFMLTHAMLAEHGKISPEAIGGFATSVGLRDDLIAERKIMFWYDKWLQEHGFPYEMKFVKTGETTKIVTGSALYGQTISCAPIVRGYYYWEPARFCVGGYASIGYIPKYR
jgi:hypothetical protein